MFFTDDKNFEKYSIIGQFENELKLNEFKYNENKFELVPFLNYCDFDIKWYNPLIDNIFDKEHKLRKQKFLKRPKNLTKATPTLERKRPIIQYDLEEEKQEENKYCDEEKILKPEKKQLEYRPISPIEESPTETEAETSIQSQKIPEPKSAVNISKEETRIKKIQQKDESTLKEQKQQTRAQTSKQERSSPGEPQAKYDRRVNLMKYWYPLKFKLSYPKKSLLNSFEQKEFLELHSKFRTRTKVAQSEVKLYKKYLHYKLQIEKERVEFFNYLKEYYKNASEDYEFINPQIELYINEMFNYLNSLSNKYDRLYLKQAEIGLNQLDINSNQKCLFQLEKNLVQIGNLHKIVIPSITIDNQPNLIIDYNRVSKRAPISKTSKKLSKIPLKEDKNAEKLAIKYNCNFVMTNSAFINLIYNLTIQNTDEVKIPFEVKEYETQDDNKIGKHKIVYIEKPLVEKHLSKREINEKFYKRSLIVSLVKQQAPVGRFKKTQISPVKPTEPEKTEMITEKVNTDEDRVLEKLSIDYNLINNLESFGVSLQKEAQDPSIDKTPQETIEKPKEDEKKKTNKRSRNSTDNENSFVNNKKLKSNNSSDYEEYETESETEYEEEKKNLSIIESKDETEKELDQPKSPVQEEPTEFKFPTPKVIPLNKTEESKSEEKKEESKPKTSEEKLSLFDLISKLQDKLIEAPSKTHIITQPTHTNIQRVSAYPTENSKDFIYLENIHDNLTYSLWTLNLSNRQIRVLIRSSTDGYINTEHSSQNSVVLYPKLEYQPQFGCERLSNKDYSRMWSKSFLRNCCDIFLCRINVFTNKLISVTKITHDELLPKDLDFNPNQSLNHLRNLFEFIFKLDKNNYLLVKDPNEVKLTILKSTQLKSGSFDLHFYYNGFNADEIKKPSYWMPIDPELYLPYHHKLNRVPCLFDPAYKENKNEMYKQNQQTKKNKKRRRKPKENKQN